MQSKFIRAQSTFFHFSNFTCGRGLVRDFFGHSVPGFFPLVQPPPPAALVKKNSASS
jgi:hypothetical protein